MSSADQQTPCLKARNTHSRSEILAISLQRPCIEFSFISQEGHTMSVSLELRFALGIRSFKSKLKNKNVNELLINRHFAV